MEKLKRTLLFWRPRLTAEEEHILTDLEEWEQSLATSTRTEHVISGAEDAVAVDLLSRPDRVFCAPGEIADNLQRADEIVFRIRTELLAELREKRG